MALNVTVNLFENWANDHHSLHPSNVEDTNPNSTSLDLDTFKSILPHLVSPNSGIHSGESSDVESTHTETGAEAFDLDDRSSLYSTVVSIVSAWDNGVVNSRHQSIIDFPEVDDVDPVPELNRLLDHIAQVVSTPTIFPSILYPHSYFCMMFPIMSTLLSSMIMLAINLAYWDGMGLNILNYECADVKAHFTVWTCKAYVLVLAAHANDYPSRLVESGQYRWYLWIFYIALITKNLRCLHRYRSTLYSTFHHFWHLWWVAQASHMGRIAKRRDPFTPESGQTQ